MADGEPFNAEALLRAWIAPLIAQAPGVRFFDAHTHTGYNDPDGGGGTVEELIASLDPIDSRAVVFTTHEPDGYGEANDRVIAEAAASDGRLVAFCRLDPATEPVEEAERCLDAGARGIKLHPRSDAFDLGAKGVRNLFGVAAERRVPVLIHAGRGIPALGEHVLELAGAFPTAPIILAHAAISDLAWIWRRLSERENVFIDTSWWNAIDLIALFALVPPGRILYASDAPYGLPLLNAVLALRCALEVGLNAGQIECMAGAQVDRLLGGDEAIDVGPAPGPSSVPADLLLERVHAYTLATLAQAIAGGDFREALEMTRLALKVADDEPQARLCRTIEGLLTLPPFGPRNGGALMLALCAARTPSVPVPD